VKVLTFIRQLWLVRKQIRSQGRGAIIQRSHNICRVAKRPTSPIAHDVVSFVNRFHGHDGKYRTEYLPEVFIQELLQVA